MIYSRDDNLMDAKLREFHREFFNALCDVFGEAVNVLIKLTVRRSGLDRNKAGTLLKFIDDSTCIDIGAIVGEFEPVRFGHDDALNMMYSFFRVTEEVLGDGVIALAKLAAEYLRKYYGNDLVGILGKIFGKIADMKIEETDGKLRFYFTPHMKDAHKYMPMSKGVPFPALVCIAAKLGERFKISKFEHVENKYCLIEVERV